MFINIVGMFLRSCSTSRPTQIHLFEGLKLRSVEPSKYLRAILCQEAEGMFVTSFINKEDGIENAKTCEMSFILCGSL
jgi:hypothetical protein